MPLAEMQEVRKDSKDGAIGQARMCPDESCRHAPPLGAAVMRRDEVVGFIRESWLDIAWVVFVGLNLLAMQFIPAWQTVPFLVIWVSLTAIYGFRLWRMGSTLATVAAVTLATGGLIGVQVLRGQEDAEYLAEVPLLATMFVVMVWHSRRRLAAMEEMQRVAEHNARLLDQQRRFLQDASHELRTPITVALGHSELVERAVSDPLVSQDARVTVDELLRLRRVANGLLILASSEDPDFLSVVPVDVDELVLGCLGRWNPVQRRWSVGELEEATVEGDADRLTMAIDALIENAVDHTEVAGRIELSVHLEDELVVVSVEDSGCGIPAEELDRIFERFVRLDPERTHKQVGCGLGLAIVKTVAEAHRGSVRARSALGRGSLFELRLPESVTRLGVKEPSELSERPRAPA
jgi:two-component system OmpR family sensor kinase